MPLRLGKYASSASEEDRRVLLQAVSNIGADMGAIIPETMAIEFVQGANTSSSESIYRTLADWLDSQISKAILGQTMTTDNGSSMAQANVHDKVRNDILRSDARQLASTITRDVLIPYIELNYGKQEVYPTFSLVREEKEDITALVDNIAKLAPFGLEVSQAELLAKLGLKEPQEGEKTLTMPEPSPYAMNSYKEALGRNSLGSHAKENAFGGIVRGERPYAHTALNSIDSDAQCEECTKRKCSCMGNVAELGGIVRGERPYAYTALNNAETDTELELGLLEAELNSGWKKVTKPLIHPVQKLIAECNSFEEVLERLPELAGAIDSTELAQALALAQFKVRGLENA